VEWDIAPADPILKQLGIRYIAFDSKPQANWLNGLTPVNSEPIDNLWIYKSASN
jgi:fructose-1,6-bisphosphatase/inositol monophosphatase family enzyme